MPSALTEFTVLDGLRSQILRPSRKRPPGDLYMVSHILDRIWVSRVGCWSYRPIARLRAVVNQGPSLHKGEVGEAEYPL